MGGVVTGLFGYCLVGQIGDLQRIGRIHLFLEWIGFILDRICFEFDPEDSLLKDFSFLKELGIGLGFGACSL